MTLTLTSDDFECHIIVNISSTLTNTTIWFVAALCFIVDVRTDVRTYARVDGTSMNEEYIAVDAVGSMPKLQPRVDGQVCTVRFLT